MDSEELKRKIAEASKEYFEGNFPAVGPVGDGLYHIGEGCYTGREGWNDFNKAVIKEFTNKKDGKN